MKEYHLINLNTGRLIIDSNDDHVGEVINTVKAKTHAEAKDMLKLDILRFHAGL